MSEPISFRTYTSGDRRKVLALFDINTPEHFAPGERKVLEAFLDSAGSRYWIAEQGGAPLAACGLAIEGEGRGRINWFMVDRNAQGQGLGRAFMDFLLTRARQDGMEAIDISASHMSEGFYARFGATTVSRQADGWGPGMHRVDMVWSV